MYVYVCRLLLRIVDSEDLPRFADLPYSRSRFQLSGVLVVALDDDVSDITYK